MCVCVCVVHSIEFHVCTINKSAHWKKSGNLLKVPHICICIYTYEGH